MEQLLRRASQEAEDAAWMVDEAEAKADRRRAGHASTGPRGEGDELAEAAESEFKREKGQWADGRYSQYSNHRPGEY